MPRKQAIYDEVRRGCAKRYQGILRAIISAGSLPRDEVTWVCDGGTWRALGDAEFALVLKENAALPDPAELTNVASAIERALESRGLICPVELSPFWPAYLRSLRPHIHAYEMRTSGEVVWGDPDVLAIIPEFSATEIPLDDGLWLLCNRMLEQLGELSRVEAGGRQLPPALEYKTVKLCLDMATSFLLFAGEYAQSYAARQDNLDKLAAQSGGEVWPFPLGEFACLARRCTDLKIGSREFQLTGDWGFWQRVAGYVRPLWIWELQRLTGKRIEADEELWRAWMRMQPLARRTRGWLYVLRRMGWFRAWRNSAQWAVMGWRGSPRMWIYGEAARLFFSAPMAAVRGERAGPLSWPRMATRLPLPAQGREWSELSAAAFANYNRFLTHTRS